MNGQTTAPLSDERLAQLAALVVATVGGPWLYDETDREVTTEHGVAVAEVPLVADGELIAETPVAVAELLAEVQQLRASVAELEGRPSRADVLREAADHLSGACLHHNPDLDEGWPDCPCEYADDIRRLANLAEGATR
ncbi:hypothetical protein [Streptomyces bohaiensis]|uniref:hypothetical protein n=1 Tax=Streptomyces bohaiensis TaxID=1431344 RepID=UPI003B7CF640